MLLDILGAYQSNRALGEPLPGGSAPYTSASAFKLRKADTTSSTKPKAKNWDHKFSLEGAGRTTSTLKGASRVKDPSKIISLGTARPASQYYPWNNITIEADSARIVQDGATNVVPVTMNCLKGESNYDLGLALNYSYAAGAPQVLQFITEHMEMVHCPPYSDWEVALTCGTTSAIDIVLRLLCSRGDSVLAEEFSYPGTIEAAKALGLNMIGIEMDAIGLLPDHLESTLSNWNFSIGPKPSLLYTIPTGQNPTGATQTVSRRKEIYEIAERHNLLILEDDPYYLIQLGDATNFNHTNGVNGADITNGHSLSSPCPRERFLSSLPPTYLSLDTSGRVLRLDATSKILAPGLRCGWITACRQLIEKFINHTDMSTVAPSGLSQAFLYKLLDETWGHNGFLDWLMHLSTQYRQRLKTLVSACEASLPHIICSWTIPSSGMFLWLSVDWRHHSAARKTNNIVGELRKENELVLEIEDQIYIAARDHGVLVSKGSWFAIDKSSSRNVFFRMTFAAASDDALMRAVERFGTALRAKFGTDIGNQVR